MDVMDDNGVMSSKHVLSFKFIGLVLDSDKVEILNNRGLELKLVVANLRLLDSAESETVSDDEGVH